MLPEDYLREAKARGWAQRIPELINRMAKLRVAFIGETIIDEYRYVRPLGMPPKEYVVAVEALGSEEFAGGIAAAANHCRSFCEDVRVITQPGFIRKTRFVDQVNNRKLFEVFSGEQKHWDHGDWSFPEVDVAVVIDFGHGMLTTDLRRQIERDARFLALNCQSNSANHGFNPVTKYNRADYVCLDLPEARLATGMQQGALSQVSAALIAQTKGAYQRLIVTHGSEGAMAGPTLVPAFAAQKIDTMGAGDAFLAITGPLAYLCDDLELIGFVGNVAGGLKLGIVGHRQPITKDMLLNRVRELLQ